VEPIQLHFTPTTGDIVRSSQRLQLESFKQPGAVGSILLLLGVVSCVIAGAIINPGPNSFLTTVIAVVSVLVIVVIFWASPYGVARRLGKQMEAGGDVTYEFSDDHFLAKDSTGELKQQWSVYHSVIVTEDFYILIFTLNKIGGRFVPRRAFESPEQEAAFRELLARKLDFKG
jgi:hypothetical protein